jgi:hypothetical protein
MKTAVQIYGDIYAGLSTAIIRAKVTISAHQPHSAYHWQRENAERELAEYEKSMAALGEAYNRMCALQYAAERIFQYAPPAEPEITLEQAGKIADAIEAEDFDEANAQIAQDCAVLLEAE